MCDRYSYTHGYICWECFDELTNIRTEVDIGEFMNSPVGSFNRKELKSKWEEEFKLRD